MATVIKYIQREVERAFSFVAYVLMARSLWWITCSCTCLVGRAHGVDQKLGSSCWNQALVIVIENKTWEAEAFEPLISCPFWPPVLHLRASMIKFLCSNSPCIRWWSATEMQLIRRIGPLVGGDQWLYFNNYHSGKENRDWKKKIQTFFCRETTVIKSPDVFCSSTPLLLSFCFVNSNWFRLSLIRFLSVFNSASFFSSVLAL